MTHNNYNRMRFKKNNKANRGVKVRILEKSITKPFTKCICPDAYLPISNGDITTPLKIRNYLWFCPAHSIKKKGVKQ